ncbi:MAG: translocation/assembly module TamB domain-containing protein [Edaphobacter sp.]
MNDGSATFAGTKYQLQRGEIYFTNPVRIDPIIDLDATAQVENYDITIGLHGTSTNLKPTYRSEPPLSETDVFALLALGRTQEEAQLYQERQVQQGTDPTTSALLGGALECDGEQSGGEAVWGGQREDRSGVCGNAGAIFGEDYGAATAFAPDYGDVCDQCEYVGAAADPGAVRSEPR